jgi:hypothetical protein
MGFVKLRDSGKSQTNRSEACRSYVRRDVAHAQMYYRNIAHTGKEEGGGGTVGNVGEGQSLGTDSDSCGAKDVFIRVFLRPFKKGWAADTLVC